MINRKRALQFLLFIALITSLLFTGLELFYTPHSKVVNQDKHDMFDSSLLWINSVDKLETYADKIFMSGNYSATDTAAYAEIVSGIVKKRFYYGYSHFGIGHNHMASAIAPFTGTELDAIVIADDILKYPNAACSQQSIVAIEILKKKGYTYRKVGFFTQEYGGHFAFEIFYNKSWHFYDPTLEAPDAPVTDRPSIAELNNRQDLLISTYNYLGTDHVIKTFKSFFYGKENAALAPVASLFQRITSFLSFGLWLILLGSFILITRTISEENKLALKRPAFSFVFGKQAYGKVG
jgi:hypothetical protein